MSVQKIPAGYHTITPYLLVENATQIMDFLKKSFDAKVILEPIKGPDGRIMHVELKIGDSILMMGEPMGEFKAMTSSLYLYVEDCDLFYKRAIQAGATSVMEPSNQFYGDRMSGVKDSMGNLWWLATHIEDVSMEELEKRLQTMKKE